MSLKFDQSFQLDQLTDEFRVWARIRTQLELPDGVLGLLEYGVTEVLNNVMDHSKGRGVRISLTQQPEAPIRVEIEDDGAGVFATLQQHFKLDSDIHAAIELVKGKMTVAPENHSGEGLFFASKMFDRFSIEAGAIILEFVPERCSVRKIPPRQGSLVCMEIAPDSQRKSEEIFSRYCDPENFVFNKTRFSLSLAAFEGNLVSRSQAKRVAARFDQFGEVELDFSGVPAIGQAFADELLRVWPMRHPETKLAITGAEHGVKKMLAHVRNRRDLPQPETE